MPVQAYFIQCITNLHVGSGDANYGIVDKLVQRDTVYNYPTIHASSLKGALREHFENLWVKDPAKVNEIFGKTHDYSGVVQSSKGLSLLYTSPSLPPLTDSLCMLCSHLKNNFILLRK